MDPISSILKITAAVLRRLADGVDSEGAKPTEPEIHYHFHEAGKAPEKVTIGNRWRK